MPFPIVPNPPTFANFIITSEHPSYDALYVNWFQQGQGAVFVGFDNRLYAVFNDDGYYFVEQDWNAPEPKDKDGYWGKWRYLRGTRE